MKDKAWRLLFKYGIRVIFFTNRLGVPIPEPFFRFFFPRPGKMILDNFGLTVRLGDEP